MKSLTAIEVIYYPKLSHNENSGPNGFPGEFFQIFKEEILPVTHKRPEN